ncbi:MAG: outer membrane protein assembly factor [Bacteroidota bacterium]
MRLKRCGVLLLFLLMINGLQLNAQHTVRAIHLEGLKKTKSDYLNRFIDSRVGQLMDTLLLQADVQRLKNLNGIADASFRIDTVGKEAIISFEMKEALTLFPILNFGGVRGNFWYQVGFNDDNWRGRGHKITAFYQNNDGRDNFSIYYKIPQFRRGRWGGSLSIMKWASIEPLFFDDATVFYDYDNFSVGLTGIYTFNRQNTLEFGMTYFVEDYGKNSRHEGIPTPGPQSLEQPKALGKLIYNRNALKYHFFYLEGLDNIASLQTVLNLDDQSWFHIFLNDTRFFKRIEENGNLALRFRAGIATNNDTPFAPFVLDSYVNIRGSGNRIERGTAALILNAEYRHTMFEGDKIAGQVVGFSDIGSWRKPGGELNDLVNGNTLQFFAGGGIRIIHKLAFNAIFRLDYGIDIRDTNRRGVVLGLGQYF